jgi:type IV pilus assembly protein PilV
MHSKLGPIHEARHQRASRTSKGMTLVEVLVTMVILSVGLLGVAAMQVSTVRNNYDAFVRSQAAVLAADILDRMRANRADALLQRYDVGFTGSPSGSTVAANDVTSWKGMLLQQLGQNAQGSIATNLATRVVTIQIQWSERRETASQAGASTINFTTNSEI